MSRLERLRIRADAASRARHDYNVMYTRLKERLVGAGLDELEGAHVLDVGCGYHAPLLLLLTRDGTRTEGVDILNAFFPDGALRTFWCNRPVLGATRAAKLALLWRPWYRRYYSLLSDEVGGGLYGDPTLLHSYKQRMPFGDGAFDAIVSNAVLEEVSDLHSFAAECARVLCPGGLLDMLWGNFYAPSSILRGEGDWQHRPWVHVLGDTETSTPLNKATPVMIAAAFLKHFDSVTITPCDREHRLLGEPGFQPEGVQAWETAEPRLRGWPKQLLTTRAFLLRGVRQSA